METKNVKHEIIIDEYITTSIMIPERMTALEFKAITTKANKLFNISDVPIVATTRQTNNSKRKNFTKADRDLIAKLYKQKKTTEYIANEFNVSETQIKAKISNMISHKQLKR